jgi:repressor LexA
MRLRKADLKARRLELGLTLEEVGNYVKVGKSTVRKWENGDIESMKADKVALLAKILQVSPLWIMGLIDEKNIVEYKTKKVPLLGEIAAGEPILAYENCQSYVVLDERCNVDFCLRVKGDSMIDARIQDGDIVFVRKQSYVENGEIAVVLIDDEVTLKRFYKDDNGVILQPENRKYRPLFFTKETFKDIKVLGKTIFFQSKL